MVIEQNSLLYVVGIVILCPNQGSSSHRAGVYAVTIVLYTKIKYSSLATCRSLLHSDPFIYVGEKEENVGTKTSVGVKPYCLHRTWPHALAMFSIYRGSPEVGSA